MATVKFYLDVPFKKDLDKDKLNERTKKCKLEGKPYPESILNDRETAIYLIMNVEGKLLKVKTKEKILPKYWQFEKEEKIKSSYTGSIELNDSLDKLKKDVLRHFRTITAKDKAISFAELKTQITAIVKGQDINIEKGFVEIFDQFVEINTKTQEQATIKKYNTFIKTVKEFSVKEKLYLSFDNIDLHFYDRFKIYLLNSQKVKYKEIETGMLNDSISKYFSTLKTFMKWAMERGYHKNDAFKNFKAPRKAKNEIVVLTMEELNKVYTHDFSSNKRLERARDLFCFGCFTGQRWSDIENFNKEDIKGEAWKFVAVKTKKETQVPFIGFSKPAKDILEKYNYQLPKISNQKLNEYLKEVGEEAKIDTEVKIVRYSGKKEIVIRQPKYEFFSSHMARRTAVSILLERGVAPTTVMRLTGHTDLRTLMKYESSNEDALTRELERIGDIGKPLMKVAK